MLVSAARREMVKDLSDVRVYDDERSQARMMMMMKMEGEKYKINNVALLASETFDRADGVVWGS